LKDYGAVIVRCERCKKNHKPSDAASHHRRPESTGTPKHSLRIRLRAEIGNPHFSTCLSSPSLSVYHSLLLKFINMCSCYTVPQGTVTLQERIAIFHLTPSQVIDIVCSQEFRSGTGWEITIQVL